MMAHGNHFTGRLRPPGAGDSRPLLTGGTFDVPSAELSVRELCVLSKGFKLIVASLKDFLSNKYKMPGFKVLQDKLVCPEVL
jgi:hypothetical protein